MKRKRYFENLWQHCIPRQSKKNRAIILNSSEYYVRPDAYAFNSFFMQTTPILLIPMCPGREYLHGAWSSTDMYDTALPRRNSLKDENVITFRFMVYSCER